MNLKWFKKNLTLVIGATVFVLLLAGLLGWQHQKRAKQQQVEERLAEEQQRLESLRASRPFPSRENVEILRGDKTTVSELYTNLTVKIGATRVDAPLLPPVEFHQRLAQRLRRLEQQARAAGVTLPESFAFGFSRYVGTLPGHRIANREERDEIMVLLAKQLQVVEELGRVLMQGRVSELRYIHRVDVEPGGSGADAVTAPIRKDPQGLYVAMPFEVQFVCGTDSLRQVLNAFTETPWLLNVRRLVVTAEAVDSAKTAKDIAGVDLAKATKLLVTMNVDLVELTGSEPVRSARE